MQQLSQRSADDYFYLLFFGSGCSTHHSLKFHLLRFVERRLSSDCGHVLRFGFADITNEVWFEGVCEDGI